MIDFSNALEILNNYSGSEKKKTLIYNDKKYLVKFPDPIREKNKNISYINNAYSEYIGSHVFDICGMKVQNTILGKYFYNGKEKIVCACEDFTDENNSLYEFENLALSINPDRKIESELFDILDMLTQIEKMNNIRVNDNLKEKFWDMFILDCLIGNTDRHNGNFGLLINNKTNEACFSPVYDCGSCLNPLLDESNIEKLTDSDIKNLAVNFYSCIKINNKKINSISFIKNRENEDCIKALIRMFPKININEINIFIDSIHCISNIRKNYYKKIINCRYNILNEIVKNIGN